MKKFNWRAMIGVMLLVLGGLALMDSLNVLHLEGDLVGLIFAAMFICGGAAFLFVMFSDHKNWWAAIPGFSLVGLGALIGLSMIPGFPDNLGAGIFLGSIGAGFLVVYFLNRQNWWAIIPAGALLSICALIIVEPLGDTVGVGVFFFGLAATFACLTIIPGPERQNTWPWYPAGILGLMGIAFIAFDRSLPAYLWPALLILGGGFLIVRSMLKK